MEPIGIDQEEKCNTNYKCTVICKKYKKLITLQGSLTHKGEKNTVAAWYTPPNAIIDGYTSDSQPSYQDTKEHYTSQESTHLDEVALDELSKQGLSKGGRAALDNDTSILESGDLGVGTTLTTADDGTGVTHAAAGGSGDTGDEGNSGLVVDVVGLEELGSIFLGGTTNLTDHDDTVGLGVLKEDLQAIDEVGAGEGVTTDTDNERLTKAGLGGLVDSLVGEGTGTGDDTDTAALVDEAGHDTDLALSLKVV